MTQNDDKMLEVHIGDRVALRKPHPCGSVEWTVYRLGADIGLRCLGCKRTVLLPRGVFNKRVKRIIRPDAMNRADSTLTLNVKPKNQKHTEE